MALPPAARAWPSYQGENRPQVRLHDTRMAGVHSARVELDGLAQAVVKVQDRLDYGVTGLAHLTYQGSPQIGESAKAANAGVIAR